MKNRDVDNAAFLYSFSMLKLLLAMQLISDEEYRRIIEISTEHYDADLYYV